MSRAAWVLTLLMPAAGALAAGRDPSSCPPAGDDHRVDVEAIRQIDWDCPSERRRLARAAEDAVRASRRAEGRRDRGSSFALEFPEQAASTGRHEPAEPVSESLVGRTFFFGSARRLAGLRVGDDDWLVVTAWRTEAELEELFARHPHGRILPGSQAFASSLGAFSDEQAVRVLSPHEVEIRRF